MVFVDISGFTKLSERLARTGREGAEHLVDTISACFSTLLAEAYANGGSLLKFGGDALLVWFAGADHAARGCSSAIAMRRTLRQIGRVRAGASSIVLRMSVGVHSGRYEMFLVGGSHREYLIGGPSVGALDGARVGGPGGPDPRQRPDRRAAPRSLPRCALRAGRPARPRPGDRGCGCSRTLRRRLRRAGGALPVDGAARPPARGAGTPRAPYRDRLVPAVRRARRPDRATRAPQAAADAVDEVVRAAQEAADRYEICILGSDIAADGGKLLFSAGAPRAIGDDEERMLLTMRHIIDARHAPAGAGRRQPRLRLHRRGGPALSAHLRGDGRRRQSRRATRGEGAVARGLHDRSVLHRAHERFARTAVPPFMVKGKSRPIEAFSVGDALRAAPASGPAVRLPLIGRDAELATITDAIERAPRRQRGAHRADRRERQREVAAALRGPRAGGRDARDPHDLRQLHAGRPLHRLPRHAAPAAGCAGTTPTRWCWGGCAHGRPRSRSSSPGCRCSRSRSGVEAPSRARWTSSRPTRARRSCTRRSCGSSPGRSPSRRSCRWSTPS